MSNIKANTTTSLDHRDLRSAAVPSKRDKDHEEKWSSHNTRSSAQGEKLDEDELIGGIGRLNIKSHPGKARVSTAKSKKPAKSGWSASKTHGRNTSKTSLNTDFPEDSTSQLSKSLLDLLPLQSNLHTSNISTVTAECVRVESKIQRNSDSNPFPVEKGLIIHLDELVDQAEKTWEEKMTERIVEGEYEVLDAQGEKTVLSRKGKKNLKAKYIECKGETPSISPDEDDGFELV
ncbi:hypothetical protein K3495_g3752 [Podosphaera aphanis]|nr:hypothetical protein K3495_g3752 [Podosphaera aphanis]